MEDRIIKYLDRTYCVKNNRIYPLKTLTGLRRGQTIFTVLTKLDSVFGIEDEEMKSALENWYRLRGGRCKDTVYRITNHRFDVFRFHT